MTQKSGKIDTTCTYYTFVTALLLLTAKVEGQADDVDNNIFMLRNLFEEALVNSSVSLFQLQQIYFNPSSHYSPLSVCLTVTVHVDIDNILNPYDWHIFNCNDHYGNDFESAFHCKHPDDTTTCKQLEFTSTYALKLSDDGSDSTELSSLLTSSDNAGVFYTFDPSFYNIMKALSTSSETPSPMIYGRYYAYSAIMMSEVINIHIKRSLENLPCRDNAIDALKMVLVWVSRFNT